MNIEILVDELMRSKPNIRVPGFEPRNGNASARFLFLLETPGRQATTSVSQYNDDPTARNFQSMLKVAGIEDSDIAIWNVVPWYLGDDRAAQPPTATDIREGIGWLIKALPCFENLQCIVLVGASARRAHIELSKVTTARILSCHHPSPKVMSTNPNAYDDNIAVLTHMRKTHDWRIA